jgi:sulfur-oxidizing protein SoxX
MRTVVIVALLSMSVTAGLALAEQARGIDEGQMSRVLRQAFPSTPPGWRARLTPDATMATCTRWSNQPPKPVADDIKRRESARIRFPDDGVFLGDWRRGEALAQSGYGMRFTDTDGKRPNGGNCYACHGLTSEEVSFGTIGISLKGYGWTHKFDPEHARLVYEKIYNSQAIVACSMMPRFGVNGILTIDQIKDLVALLMDPESPVNKEPPAPERTRTRIESGTSTGTTSKPK